MKRVKYKKEFSTLNEALNMVPNEVKNDNEVFEMTDGNKTIKVRWEGTLEEGHAVALSAEDKKLVSEDVSKMKKLMGYESKDTIGTPSAESRVTENKTFRDLLSTVKKKSLNESITIDEIAELHEIELLDEGLMSKLGKVAVMLGISLSSFMAMAQESPQKAVDTLKQKASTLSPDDVKKIQDATGIEFTSDAANKLFALNKFEKPEKLADVDLGKYGDINAIKVVSQKRDEGNKNVITLQVSKQYSSDYNFNIIRSYIGNQNKKLNNAVIKFINYDGTPFSDSDITFK